MRWVRLAVVVTLTCLASACDESAARLERDNGICETALAKGFLNVAEQKCRSALDEPGGSVLTPAVRSARLYRLATVKRQLGKYAEAAGLLEQSLALQQTLSDALSPAMVERQIEMAIILAGQGAWAAGADRLENILPAAQWLEEKPRRTLNAVLQRYAAELEKNQQPERAARLGRAAARH